MVPYTSPTTQTSTTPLFKGDLQGDFAYYLDHIFNWIIGYNLEVPQKPIINPYHKLHRAHHTLQTISELVGEITKS